MKKITFRALRAKQSDRHDVVVFAASSEEVFQIARIDRAGRNETGDLFGFQRPQVARHILEIRDYLKLPDSVLPNSIVLAFVDGVEIHDRKDGYVEITVDVSAGVPGLIVDGQQRLSALQPLENRGFQVFVSAILCDNDEELRKQFILINNTRPLPKELIYELLPTVNGLPHRLANRSFAAGLTVRLNYEEGSSLKSKIRQHTNPNGVLSSNAIQRVIMNSRTNGAIRDFIREDNGEDRAVDLISDFYLAVQKQFPEAWNGMTPRTSRLVHSSGIIALGYVMEVAYSMHGARDVGTFTESLRPLKEHMAWTSGYWKFPGDIRRWDKVQNTSPDIRMLSDFLVQIVRHPHRRPSVDIHPENSDEIEHQPELIVENGRRG